MAVPVSCPSCNATCTVSDELLGKKIRCKTCQATFVAAAATAKVGARGGDRSSTVAVKPKTASVAAPPVGAGNDRTKLYVGLGAAAFAVMAGVTAWALVREPDRPTDSSSQAHKNVAPPKIAFNDTANVETKDAVDTKAADQKSKPPATQEQPVVVSGPARFISPPVNLPYDIKPEVIDRVKRSAVWIKVGSQGGVATGSGWFAEPGIVITNSHVVGMKSPAAPPPKFLKVVQDSGMPTERTFDGKLLGIDRDNDLAVIRVDGDKLPPPVPIARSSELTEGQRLYVLGFPVPSRMLGYFNEDRRPLAMRVSSRQTHVAGRMPTHFGGIKLVQIEGGADPGNSGGMIVDTGGNARLVLVSGLQHGVVFAIPDEYVVDLLQGRMLSIVPRQPYDVGGKSVQELTAHVADPMKRIQKVDIDLWAGDPGRRIRPGGETQAPTAPGDSPRQHVALNYDRDANVPLGESIPAAGKWEMADLKDGQVYWAQPRYTGTDGKVRFGEAVVLEMGNVPVQRKPIKLSLRHKAGEENRVKLTSHLAAGIAAGGDDPGVRGLGVTYDLTEKTESVQPDGSAKVSFKYNDLVFADEDVEFYLRNLMRGVHEAARGMVTEMTVTNRGLIRQPRPKLDKVPVLIRPFLERFNVQTVQSLEAMSLILPDRELQPGDTWSHDANHTVSFGPNLTETALFKVTYRYMGCRVRDGREEAVVEFDGSIVRGEGDDVEMKPSANAPEAPSKIDPRQKKLKVLGLYGKTRGSALVDVATGRVTLARTISDMEFEVPRASQVTLAFGARLRVNFQRELTPKSIKLNPDRLLPNQELILNPFVGAPDIKLSRTNNAIRQPDAALSMQNTHRRG